MTRFGVDIGVRMETLKPRQIVYFGCLLAFGAAYINAGFFILAGVSVSHLTGDVSRIASEISIIDKDNLLNLIKVLIAVSGFLLGSVFSGYFIHNPELEEHLPYGRILVLLGSIQFLAWGIFSYYLLTAVFICSMVCGAQNALASRYKGTVLRTTHLTGLLTELGIFMGMKFKGHKIELWKIYIPVSLCFSFFTGALISSFLVYKFRENWLLISGTGYVLGGFIWIKCKYIKNKAILNKK